MQIQLIFYVLPYGAEDFNCQALQPVLVLSCLDMCSKLFSSIWHGGGGEGVGAVRD